MLANLSKLKNRICSGNNEQTVGLEEGDISKEGLEKSVNAARLAKSLDYLYEGKRSKAQVRDEALSHFLKIEDSVLAWKVVIDPSFKYIHPEWSREELEKIIFNVDSFLKKERHFLGVFESHVCTKSCNISESAASDIEELSEGHTRQPIPVIDLLERKHSLVLNLEKAVRFYKETRDRKLTA